jgi:hypothetical protein
VEVVPLAPTSSALPFGAAAKVQPLRALNSCCSIERCMASARQSESAAPLKAPTRRDRIGHSLALEDEWPLLR